MDEHEFEAKVRRVEQIDAVVRRLDPSIRSQAFTVLGGGGGSGEDVMAIAFIVLMNAAHDAQEDLKAIMAAVHALNEKKSRVRELLDPVAREDEELAKRLRCEYDDLYVSTASELGELESLRLQMALDRRSKLLETLSNLLKKLADSDNAIVENLK